VKPQRPRCYRVTGPHPVYGRRTGEEVWLAEADQIRRLTRSGHITAATWPQPAQPTPSPGPGHDTQPATRPHEYTEE